MIIADEDQLLGVCWNVSAVGGPGLGLEVHQLAVRLFAPVDALCKFPGKRYCPVNSILESFPVHRRFELQAGLY